MKTWPRWKKRIALVITTIIAVGALAAAVTEIVDFGKLFVSAKADSEEIAELREQMQARVRDSNAAFDEIKKTKSFAEGAASELAKLNEAVTEAKTHLIQLRTRNEITALADQAIAEASVEAYHQLLAMKRSRPEHKTALEVETLRVYEAFSITAADRCGAIALRVSAINPSKRTEEELDYADLTEAWSRAPSGFVRGKLAMLLRRNVTQGSLSQAEWVVSTLQKETSLEAMRMLRRVFYSITGFDGNDIDCGDLFNWWEKNKEQLKQNSTDGKT